MKEVGRFVALMEGVLSILLSSWRRAVCFGSWVVEKQVKLSLCSVCFQLQGWSSRGIKLFWWLPCWCVGQ